MNFCRKLVIFSVLTAAALGVYRLSIFLSQAAFLGRLGLEREWVLAASIVLIVLIHNPLRKFLAENTDRFLFQKEYDYQKFLKDASRGIAQIESLQHLLGLVIHFITLRMRLKNAAVLMVEPKTGEARFVHSRGYPRDFRLDQKFTLQTSLLRYLREARESIDKKRIDRYIASDRKKRIDGVFSPPGYFKEIKQEMAALKAACCVPSFLGGELHNILILGEKKSGENYSREDLNILYTLAQESAIAIENARLYDEAVRRSSELQKINVEMEVAKDRLSLALEETERANKELRSTQAQLIHEQKMATLGRLAASVGHEVNNPLTVLSMNVSRAILKYRKEPGLKVAEILDLFHKMEQNIGRIKAVVNTLTGLLKKSEKGKFEPLSLKLILEETLPLVQFQTYLENPNETDVEFDIPASVPLIRGDLERLQEVFLNLFINAFHALAGRTLRKINVTARLGEGNPKMVAVDFNDNGCGMNEEVQKKIFNYGFTTKGPGRGSGMGLYMCKYIVELHGGKIKVRSQPGFGTTFSLTLPIYEEQVSTPMPSEITTFVRRGK